MSNTRIWFSRKKKVVDPEPQKPETGPDTFDFIFSGEPKKKKNDPLDKDLSNLLDRI